MHCPCVRVAQDYDRRQRPLLFFDGDCLFHQSKRLFHIFQASSRRSFFLYSLVMVNPISIHVLEDAIVLQGNQQESAGKLLQGKLILDLKEPIKVRSVNLRFYGKMKVSWREGKFSSTTTLCKRGGC